jgi:hypothetical protein
VADLGSLIDDFLGSAETEDDYTRERLRDLRGTLAHVVASELAVQEAGTVHGDDVHKLVRELRTAGVPARRSGEVVNALRLVYAHAIAVGTLRTSPLVGIAPVAAGAPAPSPTTAMLALGTNLVDWLVRLIVIAFALTAIGLAVALL